MPIGTIIQLQVQQSSLKIEGESGRHYDPAPIQVVASLDLDPGGVVGRDERGTPVLDVHHRDHPMSKNRNVNGISIGFVTHYELMRQRVGEHLLNGLAGENILIETDQSYALADLPEHLVIETTCGEQIELVEVQVAEPCVEFTKFALQYDPASKPDATVAETVDFLRRGMRGYYATYLGAPASIQPGDVLRLPAATG